ncbi:hypothetical protein [Nonomuraea sp. NPDC049625]|uniref:hypothetical protein n=1 Tax=Nonomuraea sp. NPDC049625 TaxID=3155775 RepID=UPI003424AB89
MGWRLTDHLHADLPLDALEMAIWRRDLKDHPHRTLTKFVGVFPGAGIACESPFRRHDHAGFRAFDQPGTVQVADHAAALHQNADT